MAIARITLHDNRVAKLVMRNHCTKARACRSQHSSSTNFRIMTQMADILSNELKLGPDEDKRCSAAFVSLVAKTVFNLTGEGAIDGIVDDGNDFGVDALNFASPSDGERRL